MTALGTAPSSRFSTISIARKVGLNRLFWKCFIPLRDRFRYVAWVTRGRKLPPPPSIKIFFLRKASRKFRALTFIETGTFYGDTVSALEDEFDSLHTIELSQELFERAKSRFQSCEKITFHQGDSAEVLGDILGSAEGTCLFWLDGHYSEGDTAKALLNTPILEELKAISRSSIRPVIYIDDARCFTGKNDYPTITELKQMASDLGLGPRFEVQDDIIRIVPE